MMNTRQLSSTLDRMLTLNRAIDEALASQPVHRSGVWVPAMDIAERADAYTIQVDLPGVRPDAVELDFERNVLTIRGTKPSALDQRAESEYRVHARERVTGAFERALRLPDSVDAEGIEAAFADGVLTVNVPKARTAQPRRIAIKAAAATEASQQQIEG